MIPASSSDEMLFESSIENRPVLITAAGIRISAKEISALHGAAESGPAPAFAGRIPPGGSASASDSSFVREYHSRSVKKNHFPLRL